jgi:hypothetical protein
MRPDNTIATLRVYRCRKCAATFNDDDWQLRCTAPAPLYGRPRQAKTTEGLKFASLDEAPEQLADYVKELAKKRGVAK